MLIDALSKLGLPFKVNPFKDNSDDYGRSEYIVIQFEPNLPYILVFCNDTDLYADNIYKVKMRTPILLDKISDEKRARVYEACCAVSSYHEIGFEVFKYDVNCLYSFPLLKDGDVSVSIELVRQAIENLLNYRRMTLQMLLKAINTDEELI